jgi:hypothetical protein
LLAKFGLAAPAGPVAGDAEGEGAPAGVEAGGEAGNAAGWLELDLDDDMTLFEDMLDEQMGLAGGMLLDGIFWAPAGAGEEEEGPLGGALELPPTSPSPSLGASFMAELDDALTEPPFFEHHMFPGFGF